MGRAVRRIGRQYDRGPDRTTGKRPPIHGPGDALRRQHDTRYGTRYVSRRIPGARPAVIAFSHHLAPSARALLRTESTMATTHAPHAPPVLRPDGEIRPTALVPARERWSWALYDFANTIFSMNVATLFFTVWFIDDLGGTNTQLSIATAIASAMVALSIPILGAVSDARRRRAGTRCRRSC